MPKIDISEHDYYRLQAYAEPFRDTPATALSKVLDQLEQSISTSSDVEPLVSKTVEYRTDSLPPLTHAKLVSGQIGELSPDKSNWDAMVRLALRMLFDEFEDVSEVGRMSGANVVAGKKLDDGYKFLEPEGFSYQGVSAESAVKILISSARGLRSKLEIEFIWRDKIGAYKPGERGRISC